MKNQDVIVLGSGCSILDLSPPEIDYINNCEVIIAINKFMAFYQKSKILQTHVYFVDAYDKSTVRFLQYIFDVCRNNKLENLTFIFLILVEFYHMCYVSFFLLKEIKVRSVLYACYFFSSISFVKNT